MPYNPFGPQGGSQDSVNWFTYDSQHDVKYKQYNAAFNLRGEPIVTTPDNALNTFYASGLDTLVLGNHIVRKNGNE